jgi:hypothetical protein
MGHYHTVIQGEYLARIAEESGFDAAVVWNHAENAELRERRSSPDVLMPGDVVFVPAKDGAGVKRGTNQRHRFTVTVARPKLRLALETLLGEPLRSAKVELRIGQETIPLTADGHGIVEHAVPVGAERADLVVHAADTPLAAKTIPLFLGHLDPVTEISGQEARLDNLGYRPGHAHDPAAYDFRSAVEEFQCDYGLTVDGACGPMTQKKLVAVHGS